MHTAYSNDFVFAIWMTEKNYENIIETETSYISSYCFNASGRERKQPRRKKTPAAGKFAI